MDFIYLVRGYNADENPFYIYIKVNGNKAPAFLEAVKQPFDESIAKYGEIIAADLGNPTYEVMEAMEKVHGFNHAALLDVNDPETQKLAMQINENREEFAEYVAKYLEQKNSDPS
jgi:hypothetical protein